MNFLKQNITQLFILARIAFEVVQPNGVDPFANYSTRFNIWQWKSAGNYL